MFTKATIPLKDSRVLNKLVGDYLDRTPALTGFYEHYPDLQGFRDLVNNKPYQNLERKILVNALEEQSRKVKNSSKKGLDNIKLLASKNTYTITTGHQLCLFTGPLYFIYKIFSAIKLASELKNNFPDLNFVPVYWMASEDHDFEEVNHFHSNGGTIKWSSAQTGAVGDFKTAELKNVLTQVRETFGISQNAKELISLFEQSYLAHENLADATRFLVNELFGEYGLVTIDGNDRNLKSLFIEEFKQDIFLNVPFEIVSKTNKQLESLDYHIQVNPRPINCFYMHEGLRARIEAEGEDFRVVGSELLLTKKELTSIVEDSPERISPNVVLRPLYQQKILPNIAYVGGPGELAYWLEFQEMFAAEKVIFPVLVPRNFITVIEPATRKVLNKLNFSDLNIFRGESDLIKHLQVSTGTLFELTEEENTIKKVYADILKKTGTVDRTLDGKVAAELQKAVNALESIAGKANKAQRRKMELEISQIKKFKAALFPASVPQERYENFSTFYLKFGRAFLNTIFENAEAFQTNQIILTAE